MNSVKLSPAGRLPAAGQHCGLVLGHFDGVHIGHRALIDALRLQNAEGLPLGALCFATPPALSLSRTPAPQLTTIEEKLELLGAAGLDFAVLLDFPAVRDLSPTDFVRDILIGACHARLAVCGFNYTFGAKGAGRPEDLERLFCDDGRILRVLPAVSAAGDTVSSSRIRCLLETGDAETAADLLGRPYFLTGTVQSGRHVGHEIGTPTANLDFPAHKLVPTHGVYAAHVSVDGQTYTAVCNVGARPTFGEHTVNCETHLFDYHGDLYGKQIRVSFLRHLRAERTFSSAADLAAQIERDKQNAQRYFEERED